MQPQSSPTNSNDPPIPDYLRTDQPQADPQALPADDTDREAAANVIRQKLAAIYAGEPDAKQEAAEVAATHAPLSKHQQYMQSLSNSGKSWAEIQNAWHEYYVALPDNEKHELWQEFYAANSNNTPFQQQLYQKDKAAAAPIASPQAQQSPHTPLPAPLQTPAAARPVFTAHIEKPAPVRRTHSAQIPTVADIKKRIRETASAGGAVKKKDHMKSLLFGLASGAVVVLIFMFGFFNEFFITPFIQPSRQASETPVIVNPASASVGQDPKIIIPKINVEIPVDYSQTTTNNKIIEKALDNGVVHYPGTARPGQTGNAAFFGHSSNNIFNPGKYKFAFVMLNRLVKGDTFYLAYEGKAYVYEVISRRIVEPTEVSVLGPVPNETATATLITCDPPGTSLRRLIVVGRQISPDPATAVPAEDKPQLAATEPSSALPGNGPTLWSRLWGSVF